MAILASYNTRENWLLWYRAGTLTYGDAGWDGYTPAMNRAQRLVGHGVISTDRVLIVGSGMGYMIEAMHNLGYPNTWGLDSSQYVDSKRGEIDGNILFISGDLSGGAQIRNALRDLTGSRTFGWVVSEDVLTCYPDSDLTLLLDSAEVLLENGRPISNIVHFVTPGPFTKPEVQGLINDKTMAEWVAIRPTHTWERE